MYVRFFVLMIVLLGAAVVAYKKQQQRKFLRNTLTHMGTTTTAENFVQTTDNATHEI